MFPYGWRKGKAVALPETSDSESVAFTIMVVVTYNSNMKADFSDVRFVDAVTGVITELDQRRYLYIPSSLAIFIVKVPSKPSAETPIYYIYGNADGELKTDEVADYYWRGALDTNMEVEATGAFVIHDTYAVINSHEPGGSLITAEELSTWHSMVILTAKMVDRIKQRYFGMGPYLVGPTGGPFTLFASFGSGEQRSLTVGDPYASQVVIWDDEYLLDYNIETVLKRITLNDCRAYQTIRHLNGYSQTAQHNGESCNREDSWKVQISQSTNGSWAVGSMFAYGIEVFNLPEHVILGTESIWENLESGEEFDLLAIPDFEADETEIIKGQNVCFTDLTAGTPLTWLWDFGDGYTSEEQNPEHRYNNYGVFTVVLTVTNAFGESVETKEDYISVALPDDTVVRTLIDDVAFRIQDPHLDGERYAIDEKRN